MAGASDNGSAYGERQSSMNRMTSKVKNLFSASRKGSSSNVFDESVNKSGACQERKL